MTVRTHVVQLTNQCDDCGRQVAVSSEDTADLPPGYHLSLRRVTEAHNHSVTDPLFFCTKDCLLHAMRYRLSSLTTPIDH